MNITSETDWSSIRAMILVLGLLFVLGMLLVDGFNGLWVFRLLRRTDQIGLKAARFMGWSVSMLSLLVAGLTLMRWIL